MTFPIGGKNFIVKNEICSIFPKSWYINSNPASSENKKCVEMKVDKHVLKNASAQSLGFPEQRLHVSKKG